MGTTPFFVHKIIVTEKIAVTFLFVYEIKMIGMLLLNVNIVHREVQKSKQKHATERYSRLHNHSTLLCFSQTRETLKLKKLPSQYALFDAINHNYNHKQQTLKHRNAQNLSKSTDHRSQTMSFWTHLSKVLFPKKSSKMVDGRVKRKHQLTFELQSFLVFLRRAVITMVTMKHVHVL